MGRSPCCEKVGLKKGPWTPEEDDKLLAYIKENGHGSWRALPAKAGLQRCGKSCRLRWTNYLRPDIKRGKFSLQEEQTIIQLHALLGNRWAAIATHLSNRTDNEIKNYWNTHLKKRLDKMGIDPITHKPKNDVILSTNGLNNKKTVNLSHMAQWDSARLEAEARLVRQSKLRHTQGQNSEEIASVTSSSLILGKTSDNFLELQSPTSTITSTTTGLTQHDWNEYSCAFEPEQTRGGSCENFVEKFTDLLFSTSSSGVQCLSEDNEELDNKTFWDCILSLNSSPPNSPILF